MKIILLNNAIDTDDIMHISPIISFSETWTSERFFVYLKGISPEQCLTVGFCHTLANSEKLKSKEQIQSLQNDLINIRSQLIDCWRWRTRDPKSIYPIEDITQISHAEIKLH